MKKLKLLSAVLAAGMVLTVTATGCKSKTGSGHTHSWGEWQTVQNPTCTTAGLEKRECSTCGKVDTESIAVLNHDFGDGGYCTHCLERSISIAGKEYGEDADYISVYDKYGATTTIADVKETTSGIPYIQPTGESSPIYLGLDFLSMAMVYNCEVPAGSTEYETEEDVYAKWWGYYIERWNRLLPEIPLYSNEYYDLYSTKIKGVAEHPTNPFWGAPSALVEWTSEKSDNSIILGQSTELSGQFRYPSFGKSTPGASDNDIGLLVSGLETVSTNKEGGFVWNNTVVAEHSDVVNDDGTRTFTVKIKNNLKFSDGSAVTAKNYVAQMLVFSTPVGNEAANRDHKSGMSYVGYNDFAAYDGTNDGQAITDKNGKATGVTASKYLSGVKILDDYTYSVTLTSDYATYFYAIAQAGLSPEALGVWLDDADIEIDPTTKAVGLSDNFYTKNGDSYVKAAHIRSVATDDTKLTAYPYSGAYAVKSYNKSTKEAVLEKNTYFPGNYEGKVPTISKVVYSKVVTASQIALFKQGGVDVIMGITGGDETDEAINYVKESNGAAAVIHYGRAGYGKLGFRGDFSPVQFTEVRQAIAYCIDRSQFALDFNGGYGGTVNGPYYAGSWMYKKAATDYDLSTSAYAKSLDNAISTLEAGGWNLGANGKAYTSGVRYKRIEAAEMDDRDKTFHAVDDANIKTLAFNAAGASVSVNSADAAYYLMPLVINWYGTTDNPFSKCVTQYCVGKDTTMAQAGFHVSQTLGEFGPMLDELYQQSVYGFYGGTPLYNMFNFATGFNSAAYDFSHGLTINPNMFDDYSQFYLKDAYDYYFLPEKA